MRYHEIRGDGNSLYRALAIELERGEEYYSGVRKDLLTFKQENRLRYVKQFQADKRGMAVRVRRDNFQEEHYEMVVALELFKVAIAIYMVGEALPIYEYKAEDS